MSILLRLLAIGLFAMGFVDATAAGPENDGGYGGPRRAVPQNDGGYGGGV